MNLLVTIQFIEISHAQSQIGVSEQLDRLGLSEAHEQCVNVLLDCTFLEQTSKLMCGFHQTFIVQVSTNDDTGRIVLFSLTNFSFDKTANKPTADHSMAIHRRLDSFSLIFYLLLILWVKTELHQSLPLITSGFQLLRSLSANKYFC